MDPITLAVVAAALAGLSGILKTVVDSLSRKNVAKTVLKTEGVTIQVDPKAVTPEQLKQVLDILANRGSSDIKSGQA
jgi:hypothetical protein